MLGWGKKKKEKERIKKEALENAKTEQVIRIIEDSFPLEMGLRSYLGSTEMLEKVLNLATGKVPKNRYLFFEVCRQKSERSGRTNEVRGDVQNDQRVVFRDSAVHKVGGFFIRNNESFGGTVRIANVVVWIELYPTECFLLYYEYVKPNVTFLCFVR